MATHCAIVCMFEIEIEREDIGVKREERRERTEDRGERREERGERREERRAETVLTHRWPQLAWETGEMREILPHSSPSSL